MPEKGCLPDVILFSGIMPFAVDSEVTYSQRHNNGNNN